MEKQSKKRVVLYYRGANEKDYEIQKKQLQQYVAKENCEIVAEIKDAACEQLFERAGIQEILQLAKGRAMDEVVAVCLSRFSRDHTQFLRFNEMMRSENVIVKTPEGDWWSDRYELDRLALNIGFQEVSELKKASMKWSLYHAILAFCYSSGFNNSS